MSKRTDRREAERAAHKLALHNSGLIHSPEPTACGIAYQQRRQPAPVQAAQTVAQNIGPTTQPEIGVPLTAFTQPDQPAESDLLARAHAFFERPEPAPASTQTTQAQIQANQANAQKSTGPTTAAGKTIASQNNTRHGLAGDPEADNFKVLATENQNAYHQLLADFRKEWQPATATEHDFLNRLVMHKWLRQRALRLQETLFSTTTGELTDVKKFDLYRRYENAHERGYNKVFADLLRLRAFQLRERNGFESQQRKNEEHEFKMLRLKRHEELEQASQNAKAGRETHQPLQKAA